jgi:hypothetical protein
MHFDTDESKTAVCSRGHSFQIVGAENGDVYPCQEDGCLETAVVKDK